MSAERASKVTVALDVMSGDESPRSRIRAAVRALDKYPSLNLILVGDEPLVEAFLSDIQSFDRSRLSVHHTETTVCMDEKPSQALRSKKKSSMWCSLQLLAEEKASACVSAGNTGALMAMGCFVLKTFPGITRPAISVTVPTREGGALLMDVGANVDCSPEHLYQLAVMGSQQVVSVKGIKRAKVALLNIGMEEEKGNEQVRKTHTLMLEKQLQHQEMDYIGFVEANDLFNGRADVVICDGFVGNVALKTGEGAISMIQDGLKEAFKESFWGRLLYLLVLRQLQTFNRRVDPVLNNGASLLGLNGTVIKSHGGADEKGFYKAICQAVRESETKVPVNLASRLEDVLV